MKHIALTPLLLLTLLALSTTAPVLAQEPSMASLEGYIDERAYNVTYTIEGYSQSLENVFLDFSGESTGTLTSGSLNGIIKTTNKTVEIDAYIDYQTSITVNEYSFQAESSLDGSLSLVVNLAELQANQTTTPLPIDTLNLSISVSSTSESMGDFNETYTSTSATASLSLIDGMQMIGFGQGDIVMDIYLEQSSYTNNANNTQHLEGTLTIDFNSGNQLVDNQLAMFLYQMLAQMNLSQTIENSLKASNATIIEVNITLSLDPANAAVELVYNIRYQAPDTIMLTGFTGSGMQQAPLANMTLQAPQAVPAEPVNFSMSTYLGISTVDGQHGYDYVIKGNFTLESSRDLLAYTGVDYAKIDGYINDGNYTVIIILSGGDPYTAAPIIKGFIDASIAGDTAVNVTITSGPNVMVYEVTESGLEPLSRKVYTNSSPIAIVIEINGSVVEAYNDTIKIAGATQVEAPAIAFLAYDSLVVNATSVTINLPEPILLSSDYNISFDRFTVNLESGSTINPGAEFRIITVTEANATLTDLGYAAAGPGIAVSGVDGSGIVVIDLGSIPDDLKVLRVLGNGTVQELEYTIVDGKVIAVTPGFSMIIPATPLTQGETQPSETTNQTGDQTTPETGQEEQNQTSTETGEGETINETEATIPSNETSTDTGSIEQNATESTQPETPPQTEETPDTTQQEEAGGGQEQANKAPAGEEPAQNVEDAGETEASQPTDSRTGTEQVEEAKTVDNATVTQEEQKTGGSNTLIMAAVALLVLAIAAVALLRR